MKTTNFLPNIRVRIISTKVSSGRHQYMNEKGVIVDILPNAKVTLQMDSTRQVLEKIPSKYLETVIPKLKNISQNNAVCLLKGKFRGKKGRLLDKKRDESGSVQLWEDGNIVTVRLDDMAEWCGSSEDAYLEH